MIYPPGKDSFLLKKHIKDYANGSVLDLGTGSGILAKEAKKYIDNVLAVDINKKALKKITKIKTKYSDLFSNIKEKFDLIMFNPPYLPENIKEKPEDKIALCGGKEGYEIIFKFLEQAKSHLNKNGKILMVFSSLSDKEKIESKLKKLNYKFKLIDQEKFFMESLYLYLIE